MMIPHHLLLPQDKVLVRDLGPTDKRHARPVETIMHASDAKHALTVEPHRYELVDRVAERAVKAKPRLVPADLATEEHDADE